MENIILGSAGWRNKYAGKDNILSIAEIKTLLLDITDSGIKHIDTAPSYGDAEEIILKWTDQSIRIDTKLDKFENLEDFHNKLKRLGRSTNRIHTIYFHDPEIMQKNSPNELFKYYEEIKNRGCNMGFSLYDLESLEIAYTLFPNNFDVLFQLPINLLDLKFIKFILEKNIELDRIIARSIFSRGLIFIDDSQIPSCFPNNYFQVKELFEKFYQKPFRQKSLFELTFSLIKFFHKRKIKTLFGVNTFEEIHSIIQNSQKKFTVNFEWDDMIQQSKTINKIEDLVL
tara:strand:- start:6087 stop:6941 length:855 start_codon:yes stop_codon:yes gene_type:complete